MHPLYEKLLEDFCQRTGLDARLVAEMCAGTRVAPPLVVQTMWDELGIAPRHWRSAPRGKPGNGVAKAAKMPVATPVEPAQDGSTDMTPAVADKLFEMGRVRRRSRKIVSSVHEVLDRLGWTVQDLAERIAAVVGRPISRASVQNWSMGQRQVGPAGRSKPVAVRAPLDVRLAAHQITRAEADRVHLGERAVLLPGEWPNVERDADTDR